MAKVPNLFLLLYLWGCSAHKKVDVPAYVRKLDHVYAYPSDVQPARHITFKQDATYGDTKDVIVGDISGLAVSHLGRVFIGNSNLGLFFIYAPDGTFITRLGGKGKGPGEFSHFSHPAIQSHILYQ